MPEGEGREIGDWAWRIDDGTMTPPNRRLQIGKRLQKMPLKWRPNDSKNTHKTHSKCRLNALKNAKYAQKSACKNAIGLFLFRYPRLSWAFLNCVF